MALLSARRGAKKQKNNHGPLHNSGTQQKNSLCRYSIDSIAIVVMNEIVLVISSKALHVLYDKHVGYMYGCVNRTVHGRKLSSI